MQYCSKEAIKEVVNQMLKMYSDSILEGKGTISFENWCEDGDVFMGLECEDECIKLMEEVSPCINNLTATFQDFMR